NFWGRMTDPNYVPADFEHGTQPGFEALPQVQVFEGMEDLSAEDRLLFQEALAESGASPDLDLINNNQQRDLEIIAILSSVNTAVTVMVLGFLYMVGRPRSGAALALHMMYPIDIWNSIDPPADFIRLLGITIASGLFAVPAMIKVGKGMLKVHELVPLRNLVLTVTIFITVLVYISTNWIGVGTLVIGTMIGLMAPRIGIRRSHGMGVILVPIMVYTFARELDAFGFA
ncbi:MAG: tripartite tricarboxylate transporter permease, partial [Candidatus Poseidoniales archaeon]|nr:tripartite tricarboxylate transporter permease [Candidatus Poseidoniales archaeon]